ncbi:MAG: HD domain-containing phosphohydrolase [Candidatus Omnitrophota bacterium]
MITDDIIRGAQILIIDDDEISIRLLEEIFEKAGYKNVHSSTDSTQAVSLFESIQPDLLVLDLWMPSVTGFEVMEQLRQMHADTFLPIIVLSHDSDHQARFKALESGAKDFLNKPYDRIEVLIRFRNLIEAQMLHKQAKDQNRLLEDKVKERTRQLSNTQLDVITRLARAIEYRDSETGLHIVRMSHYSARLAQESGLSPAECDSLLTAAPLHDIGKIGIPDRILQKPGRLTDEEWEVMKTHTTIGAELLSGSNSEFMKMARLIALTHHEKWDGSGYPKGIKETSIPLVGRICGLCDVFDALMTARPYKGAWKLDQTMEEIKDGKGKHFDPDLVDSFVRILPDIQKIQEQYVDPHDEKTSHF